jgi:hypothetical protein
MSYSKRVGFTFEEFNALAQEMLIPRSDVQSLHASIVDSIESMDEMFDDPKAYLQPPMFPASQYISLKENRAMEIVAMLCGESRIGEFRKLEEITHVLPEPAADAIDIQYGFACVVPETNSAFVYNMYVDRFYISNILDVYMPNFVRFAPQRFLYAFGPRVSYRESSALMADVYKKIADFEANEETQRYRDAGGFFRRMDHFSDQILQHVNQAAGGYGVERIDHEFVDSYWHSLLLLYVNFGDTYDETLIFNPTRTSFEVGSWGDYVEGFEAAMQDQDYQAWAEEDEEQDPQEGEE